MTDVQICPAVLGDAGEILTLQRAAYVTEAQLYAEPMLPPLTQTYADLVDEMIRSIVVKAVAGTRIVGSGRGRVDGETLHIGRLAVAPDLQGNGIGTRILTELERGAPPEIRRLALFTGHLSTANLHLYERLGFVETHRMPLSPKVVQVYLEKQRIEKAH